MEQLMQYLWQYRLWPREAMATTDGRPVRVIDPGLLNRDSGPDFFNAKLSIGGDYWVGNVEIHVRASDWFRHHHDSDRAYDSVILHVVYVDDATVLRPDGRPVPQMLMDCSPDFSARYDEMVNCQFRDLPCGDRLASVPSIYVSDWLNALAFERLYAKADRVGHILEASGNNWSEAIYVTVARALGFGINSDPFQMLAQSTPLKYMLHHADSPLSVEAMLFGQAGMLDDYPKGVNEYRDRLADEYRFLCAKFSLQRSHNIMWKMSRMRPQNLPHRRIAALARLVCDNVLFSNRVLEAESADAARTLFDVTLSGYWATHYSFSAADAPPAPRAFSRASVDVLLINVVVPLMFAYALSTGDARLQDRAVTMLQSLRPESNRIVEAFARAGVAARDAFTTQALIQLRRTYCDSRKCLYCRLGHRLLSALTR